MYECDHVHKRPLFAVKQAVLRWTDSVPARLGKRQGAKEIGHNLARERPKSGHNLACKRQQLYVNFIFFQYGQGAM